MALLAVLWVIRVFPLFQYFVKKNDGNVLPNLAQEFISCK